MQLLPRGHRFEIGGVSMLSFGGAASVDYSMRATGHDWFITEIPTPEDAAAAIAGGPARVMITHDTVNGGTAATEQTLAGRSQWDAEALAYSKRSRDLVTDVWNGVTPEILLHGHMHAPDTITLPDGRRVVSLGRDDQWRNLGVLELPSLDFTWLGDVEPGPRIRRTRDVEGST